MSGQTSLDCREWPPSVLRRCDLERNQHPRERGSECQHAFCCSPPRSRFRDGTSTTASPARHCGRSSRGAGPASSTAPRTVDQIGAHPGWSKPNSFRQMATCWQWRTTGRYSAETSGQSRVAITSRAWAVSPTPWLLAVLSRPRSLRVTPVGLRLLADRSRRIPGGGLQSPNPVPSLRAIRTTRQIRRRTERKVKPKSRV